jgi:hypothetical protein
MAEAALPFILQMALFGAAGTIFVRSHLRSLNARTEAQREKPPSQRWRTFRHPHLSLYEDAPLTRRLGGIGKQTLWGFAFLLLGAVTPVLFQLVGFH